MELVTQYSPFYIILCLFLAFVYSYILYYKQKKSYNNSLINFLFITRFISVNILLLLLLAPVLKSTYYQRSNPVVIIAQDVSSSIKDSTYDLLNNLKEDFIDCDVYSFSFADYFDTVFSRDNIGLETNFSNLLNNIEDRFIDQEISALIIASDGLYNSGSNPLYGRHINYPIYPIALGDTTINKDISIIRVYNNDFAFRDNRFPIEISISAKKLKGENVELNILNNKQVVYSESIDITNDDYFVNKKVLIEATELGVQKYEIKLSVLEQEKNKKNNLYNTYIDVIDSRYNVLIINSFSHPDLAAYRSVLEQNKNYMVEVSHVNDFIADNLNNYHLLVLFGEITDQETIQMINSSEIPLLIFGLDNLERDNVFTPSVIFNSQNLIKDVYSGFNHEFSRFTFSDDLQSFINTAPPLNSFLGKFNFSGNVDVVLKERVGDYIRDNPLIFISQQKRKVGVVAADGFWRWKFYDYANKENNKVFNELFIKLTQYLVLEDLKERFVVDYQNRIQENKDVVFEARLFNESFELINNKEIEIIISNEDGDDFHYVFSDYLDFYKLSIGKLETGNYSFIAKVRDEKLIQEGVFEVKSIELEGLTEVADHHFLAELARLTNGKMFFKDQSSQLISEISNHENHQNIIYETEKSQEIINIYWILLSLLFLILLEWIVRRYNGLI
mgnify:CR=1 FL=1